MASSPTPQGSLRQRNVAGSGKKNKEGGVSDVEVDKIAKAVKAPVAAASGSERDYKIVFALITAAAFVTRFWGITHPNEVVFDEVHFGKVSLPAAMLLPARSVLGNN